MNKNKLVSVIIPVYNVEDYLEKCINSVLNQQYEKLQIIIVNDGSTDRSAEICGEYEKKDSRIEVIHQKNSGLSAARNVALKRAVGDYIIFVDGDDYISPQLVGKTICYMEKFDMCVYRYQYEYSNGSVGPCGYGWGENKLFDIRSEEDKIRFFNKIFFFYRCGWNVCHRMFKRSIIQKYNLKFQDTKEIFAEDHVFTYQYTLHVDSCIVLDDILYHYVERSNSIMHTLDMESVFKRLVKLSRIEEAYAKIAGYPGVEDNFWIYASIIFYGHYCMVENKYGFEEILKYKDIQLQDTKLREYAEKVCREKKKIYKLCGRVQGRCVVQMLLWILHGNKMEYKTLEMEIYILNQLYKAKMKLSYILEGTNRKHAEDIREKNRTNRIS